jgi:hypothetical protein
MRVDKASSSGISLEIRRTALPSAARTVDEGVDLRLGPDVDAARGLVQDEDPAARGQPAREDDLLLVAAGEARRREVEAGSAHAQLRELVRDQRFSSPRCTQVRRASRSRIGSVVFGAPAEHEHEALPLPVFGHQPEPEAERRRRIPDRDRRAIDGDDACGRGIEPEQGLRHLGAAGPDEPRPARRLRRSARKG